MAFLPDRGIALTARKRKILVIDDDPGIRESLDILLNNWGFEPLQAADANEAMQIVEHQDPDIVISGESGTGKELVARGIHDLSTRQNKPFVAINAAAMPETLIESEIFGHERGAFTGAIGVRPGCFEQAHGGTLFLDEIAEMPMSLQPKLLRVLSDGRVRRLGGSHEFEFDVRVVAATNRDPLEA